MASFARKARSRSVAELDRSQQQYTNLDQMMALGVDVNRLALLAMKHSGKDGQQQGFDSYSNPLARQGWGTSSLAEAAWYPITRLTNDWYTINSLYRNSWLIRRLIDTVAHDMTKAWIRVNSTINAKKIRQLMRVMQITRTRAAVTDSLRWSRLYGGAGAVMILKGHDLEQPLELDDVGPGDYQGLLVFDRWSGIIPEGWVASDLESPTTFQLPEYYTCTTSDTNTLIKVHASRVLRYENRSLPQWEKQAAMGWGEAEPEVVYEELKKRDNTSFAIVNLMFRANLLAINGIDNAEQLFGVGTDASKQKMHRAISEINHMLSNQGLLALPKDSQLQTHQYSFGGVGDVYELFALDMCGAAEMPMTKLFGRTATGLGQSNDSDEQMWEDKIATDQSFLMRPEMEEKLMPVIAMSTWGFVPDDFDWTFNSIHKATDKEQAELAEKKTASIVSMYTAGITGRKSSLMEARDMSEQTGMWAHSITDEDIDAADNDPVMGEGGLGLGGGEEDDEQGGEGETGGKGKSGVVKKTQKGREGSDEETE